LALGFAWCGPAPQLASVRFLHGREDPRTSEQLFVNAGDVALISAPGSLGALASAFVCRFAFVAFCALFSADPGLTHRVLWQLPFSPAAASCLCMVPRFSWYVHEVVFAMGMHSRAFPCACMAVWFLVFWRSLALSSCLSPWMFSLSCPSGFVACHVVLVCTPCMVWPSPPDHHRTHFVCSRAWVRGVGLGCVVLCIPCFFMLRP
jgi:hypothetical protein